MASALFTLALTATLIVLCSAQKSAYCELKSCQQNSHTLCKYPFLQVSKNCRSVQSSSLTSAEIQELLDVHNRLRNRVASGQETRGNPGPQPAAKNLGPLQWSTEIAEIAQTWADQCIFDHDTCRDTASYQVGQNIVYRGSTGTNTATLTDLVTDWYNEVDLFNRSEVKSYEFSTSTGHYTQLVWAKTMYLGCGAIRYNDDGKWNKFYLVCNYGPAGNWAKQPVYETR